MITGSQTHQRRYFVILAFAILFVLPMLSPLRAQGNVAAVDDPYTLSSIDAQFIAAPGVLANDSPGATVVAYDFQTSLGNNVTVNPDGSVSLASANGAAGIATFSYTIADGAGSQDTATVTITYEVPPPPVDALDDGPYTLNNNESHSFDAPGLLGNDSSGSTIVGSDISSLFDGTGYVNPDGSWYIVPLPDFVGAISFTYTIQDTFGAQDTASVSLIFEVPPAGIVTVSDLFTTQENMPLQNANVLDNDTGVGLTVLEVFTPELSLFADGTLNYTPPAGYIGSFSAPYTVRDAFGNGAESSYTITVSPAPTGCGYDIPQSECDVLVNLYNSTNGAGWLNTTGWAVDFAAPCSWYGVSCSDGHVTGIALPNNNLSGTLSALPPFLADLFLDNNQLTGSIPVLPDTSFTINLANNQFSGTLPALPASIQSFLAHNNQLTGGIPPLPSSLLVLSVHTNQLTGNIPTLPSSLWELAVTNNQLTGNLPTLPSSLYLLWVSDNTLSGEIPASITSTAIVQDQRLRLCGGGNTLYSTDSAVNTFINSLKPGWSTNNGCSANQPPTANAGADQTVTDTNNDAQIGGERVTLNGSLSSDPDGMIVSYSWTENGTEIATGATPSVILAVGIHTITLTVSDNRAVTATDTVTITVVEMNRCASQTQIPQSECYALVNLYNGTNGASWLNRMGWTVTDTPCSWYGITCAGGHVTQIQMQGNNLIGTLPDFPQAVRIVDLSHNRLSGNIPILPTSMLELRLVGNQLSGSIPVLPASMTVLWLNNNQLSGTVPALPATMIDLQLNINQLSGTIPTLPVTMKTIFLSRNQLSGSIPVLPPALNLLGLANNQLNGPIPLLPQTIVVLRLEGNELSGPIPTLPLSLSELDLSNNQLTGIIPELPQQLARLYLDNNAFFGEVPSSITATQILSGVAQDLRLCGGENGLYSTDSVVNAFLDTRESGWSPNNGCFTNVLPIANAGADQTVTDTDNSSTNTVKLDGSLSSDSDGAIVTYSWSESGVEFAKGPSPEVTLLIGVHTITLTVTDNRGGTAMDTVTIEVVQLPNVLPIANAGPDLMVTDADNSGDESVGLGGSESSDPDGTIVSYSWSKDLVEIATGASPTVNLAVGVHTVTLTVTDNRGGTATDTVTIDVVLPPNIPPTANAGADFTVMDIENNGSQAVTLNGGLSSDSDGTIVDYSWSRNAIQIAAGVTPSVNLPVGTHVITLTVTDNRGDKATDSVTIEVVLPPNVLPTANAGADQAVTDTDNNGSESVTLNGSLSSDSDGSIASYSWSENGIQVATGANPTVNLATGTHTITLSVTDNRGGTAMDTVTITVNAPTPSNTPPQLTIYSPEIIATRGSFALNLGEYRDPDGDRVSLTASIGSIIKSGNSRGGWIWSYIVPPNTPRGTSITVTITATDARGAVTTQTFRVRVR